MYEDVCSKAYEVDESVRAGDEDLLKRFGPDLDGTLKQIQDLHFRAEDLAEFPAFKDLLVKRRVQKFNDET